MTLSKKHFEQIGKFLAYQKAYFINDTMELWDVAKELTHEQKTERLELIRRVFDELIRDFIQYFTEENPRFDPYRFLSFIDEELKSWLDYQ